MRKSPGRYAGWWQEGRGGGEVRGRGGGEAWGRVHGQEGRWAGRH